MSLTIRESRLCTKPGGVGFFVSTISAVDAVDKVGLEFKKVDRPHLCTEPAGRNIVMKAGQGGGGVAAASPAYASWSADHILDARFVSGRCARERQRSDTRLCRRPVRCGRHQSAADMSASGIDFQSLVFTPPLRQNFPSAGNSELVKMRGEIRAAASSVFHASFGIVRRRRRTECRQR